MYGNKFYNSHFCQQIFFIEMIGANTHAESPNNKTLLNYQAQQKVLNI